MDRQRALKFLFSPFRILTALVAAVLGIVATLPAAPPATAAIAMMLAVLVVVFGIGYSLARLAVSLENLQAQLDAAREHDAALGQRQAALEAAVAEAEKKIGAAGASRKAEQESASTEMSGNVLALATLEASVISRIEHIAGKQTEVLNNVRDQLVALAAQAEIAFDTDTVHRMDLADIRQDIRWLRMSQEELNGTTQPAEGGGDAGGKT